MPKRVSLKGKGADIFFGEYGQGATSTAAPPVEAQSTAQIADDNSASEASNDASTAASTLASERADVEIAEDQERSKRPTRSNSRTAAAKVAEPTESPNGLQTMLTSELVFYRDELIERIRRTVKVPGREVSYIRLTPEEKAQLAKMVYGFRSRGKKTTENEINRIAVNFMILDYQANGEDSLLVKVIDALLA